MYGTVARLRVKPGMTEQLEALSREWQSMTSAGLVSSTLYRMDADPNEVYLAVVFQDRESYRKNAEDSETDALYRRMREMLDADPEWHDGEVIASAF